MNDASRVKRRIVYFTDEEWETARSRAAEGGVTISSYMRTALSDHGRVKRILTQAERDAILRRISKKG